MGASRKHRNVPRLTARFASVGQADPDDREAPRPVLEPDLASLPHSAICAIDIEFDTGDETFHFDGTGWFITPRVVITAGHCLFDDVSGGRFASSIRIRDASGRKIGPITPRFNDLATPRHPLNFFIERSWYDKLDDGASARDYGAILLEPQEIMADGQHQQSSIPYTSVEDSELSGAQVTIAGYPSTLPDNSRPDPRRMCSDTKRVTSCDATLIFYKVGTRDGQSGSPICMNRCGQQLCGIGIHTGSADKVHRTDLGLNVGIRFTRELQQELSSLALAVESGSSDDWVNERWERGA